MDPGLYNIAVIVTFVAVAGFARVLLNRLNPIITAVDRLNETVRKARLD